MRSRAARLTSCALACLALGSAALFLRQTNQQLITHRDNFRQFERRAYEASASISAAQAAQQAYVAAGQSSSVWVPKAKAFSSQAVSIIASLRTSEVSTDARQALIKGAASVAEFDTIDRRARDYLTVGEPLMASDVVFSEGAQTVADVQRQLELARQAEYQAHDLLDGAVRQRQTYAAGGGALFAALVLVALGISRRERTAVSELSIKDASVGTESLPIVQQGPAPVVTMVAGELPSRDSLALNAAADVCTAFGQVQDTTGLRRVLGQAATALDASGLVVWLGSVQGADLRPLVAHGYSEQVLALMRPVPRQADNAAATAYRTSKLQIVAAKPGTSLGAVVAPILAADGCIGALTAEIRGNGEVSEAVHAMATIIASQLAGVLSSAVQATTPSHAASA